MGAELGTAGAGAATQEHPMHAAQFRQRPRGGASHQRRFGDNIPMDLQPRLGFLIDDPVLGPIFGPIYYLFAEHDDPLGHFGNWITGCSEEKPSRALIDLPWSLVQLTFRRQYGSAVKLISKGVEFGVMKGGLTILQLAAAEHCRLPTNHQETTQKKSLMRVSSARQRMESFNSTLEKQWKKQCAALREKWEKEAMEKAHREKSEKMAKMIDADDLHPESRTIMLERSFSKLPKFALGLGGVVINVASGNMDPENDLQDEDRILKIGHIEFDANVHPRVIKEALEKAMRKKGVADFTICRKIAVNSEEVLGEEESITIDEMPEDLLPPRPIASMELEEFYSESEASESSEGENDELLMAMNDEKREAFKFIQFILQSPSCTRDFLLQKNASGFSALRIAAHCSFYEAADAILSAISEGSPWDHEVLCMASYQSHSSSDASSGSRRKFLSRALRRKDANPNYKDSRGWAPIHYAARGGDQKCIRLLIAAGADPCASIGSGVEKQKNAAEIAASFSHMGSKKLLEQLSRDGVSI